MAALLASAEHTDLTGPQWSMILIGLLVLAVVAALALVPIGAARRRRPGRAEAIVVGALFWALLSAGSIIKFVLAKVEWSQEYVLLIKTGYYDPADTSGAPAWPWGLWGGLALAFAVLLACSLSRRRPPPPPLQPPPR
jgi:hypothetical protein